MQFWKHCNVDSNIATFEPQCNCAFRCFFTNTTLMNYEWFMRAWRYMASVCIVTESTIRSVCLKSKPVLPVLTDDLRPYRGQALIHPLEGCKRVIRGVSWKSLNYLGGDPWVIVELFRKPGGCMHWKIGTSLWNSGKYVTVSSLSLNFKTLLTHDTVTMLWKFFLNAASKWNQLCVRKAIGHFRNVPLLNLMHKSLPSASYIIFHSPKIRVDFPFKDVTH